MIKYIKNFNFCHFILFFYPLNCAKYPFLRNSGGRGPYLNCAKNIFCEPSTAFPCERVERDEPRARLAN